MAAALVSMNSAIRILLIDLDDARRDTRLRMLAAGGYDVEVYADHRQAEDASRESTFDLVILAMHTKGLDEAAAYSERLRKGNPTLPILLLLDAGVFVPHGTLSRSLETGMPVELMREVAAMLAGSSHIRELMSVGRSV